MEVYIVVLDVVRVLYTAVGLVLAVLLAHRSARWAAKFREPSYLHLAAMFFTLSAVVTGLMRIGEDLTITFPLNVLGVFCLSLFVWKVPEEKAQTWREQRGDPPDWDARFGGD